MAKYVEATDAVLAASRVCPFDPSDSVGVARWHRLRTAALIAGGKTTAREIEERAKITKRKRVKKSVMIGTIDLETDPFDSSFRLTKQRIEPFACGVALEDGTYREFWGDDCIAQFIAWLDSLESPLVLYAHNGGKFDFKWLLHYIEPDAFVINMRIVEAKIARGAVTHTLRDSYSIMPVKQDHAAAKLKIDYEKMKREHRFTHRAEISQYLRVDCTGLLESVQEHRKMFGPVLTMASAAMNELQAAMRPVLGVKGRDTIHERFTEDQDDFYRRFYYGGRVECFSRGIFNGNYRIYDITSSYPNVMCSYMHPIGRDYYVDTALSADTDFATIIAESDGALPYRSEDGELCFPKMRGTFHATGHEIRMAIELGKLRIHKVLAAYTCTKRTSFAPFVNKFWKLRLDAKSQLRSAKMRGDRSGVQYWESLVLFYKLVLNSSYGKFAQNPRKFKDYKIIRVTDDTFVAGEGWSKSGMYEDFDIYEKPSDPAHAYKSYYNVACGASITGAARAELLRGISLARDVLYCDTDSLICSDFAGQVGEETLGAWKLEVSADTVAIAEKKLYALFADGACVKSASKGVRMDGQQILDVAGGAIVEHANLAPTIGLDGSQRYIQRRISRRDNYNLTGYDALARMSAL